MAYKNNKQNGFADSIVGIIEKGIDSLVGLFLPKPSFAVFKKGELTDRWNEIEQMNGNLAVIEADKLADAILKRANIAGNSMAERLRATESLINRDAYQGMWDAHKLRNNLVHDVDHLVNQTEINIALMKIKKFLTELGAFENE